MSEKLTAKKEKEYKKINRKEYKEYKKLKLFLNSLLLECLNGIKVFVVNATKGFEEHKS